MHLCAAIAGSLEALCTLERDMHSLRLEVQEGGNGEALATRLQDVAQRFAEEKQRMIGLRMNETEFLEKMLGVSPRNIERDAEEYVQELYVGNTKITDAGLEHVKKLNGLKVLSVGENHITDKELEHVKWLKGLQELYVWNTQITDDGLRHLRELEGLKVLGVENTQITNEGLKYLKGLKELKILRVNNTQITDEGKRRFNEERTNLGLPLVSFSQ